MVDTNGTFNIFCRSASFDVINYETILQWLGDDVQTIAECLWVYFQLSSCMICILSSCSVDAKSKRPIGLVNAIASLMYIIRASAY